MSGLFEMSSAYCCTAWLSAVLIKPPTGIIITDDASHFHAQLDPDF